MRYIKTFESFKNKSPKVGKSKNDVKKTNDKKSEKEATFSANLDPNYGEISDEEKLKKVELIGQ